VAILIAAGAVLVGSFFALHERTGAEIRGRIDDRLQADLVEFRSSPAGRAHTPAELQARGRRFIGGQGYHPDSRIFVITARGGRVATNQGDLVREERDEGEAEHERESRSGAESGSAGLFAATSGISTVKLPGGGSLRVLTDPVTAGGRPIGAFRVAESLGQASFAQGSLGDTLLIVGAAALVVLAGAALWIAALVARPLRQMAGFAAEIDTGGLERRLVITAGPAEVRSLADSFNRMLDRLQAAFDRERAFVADASHELRTPVTIARGELDLLSRDVSSTQRERLDVARRELGRMERLITEMLSLAAQESNGSMRLEPVLISDLLADLRRDLPLMGPRRYLVGDLGGTVEADPDRLAQVFRNVLANAVAHTTAGEEIRVSARAAGERVRFTVHDTGPGISPGEAERLFDRFYRTDRGRARNGGGSGLGLAIARAIVEAHGGRIWAAAGSGEGATISFELPGYRPEAQGAPARPGPGVPPDPPITHTVETSSSSGGR
jgi:signal transduction histidine kinase